MKGWTSESIRLQMTLKYCGDGHERLQHDLVAKWAEEVLHLGKSNSGQDPLSEWLGSGECWTPETSRSLGT